MTKDNSSLNGIYEIEAALSLSEPLPAVDVWLVLDLLRASTTIVTWFERGGKAIYPEASVEAALALKTEMFKGGHTPLLMGEVNSVPPNGFDAGNSPLEINEQSAIRRPTAIIATTNGTKAIHKAVATGAAVYIVCARNALYALDSAIACGRRIGILCAGRLGLPAIDDTICAGMMIEKICNFLPEHVMSDGANIALRTWINSTGSFEHNIRSAVHAKFLEKIGFSRDISYACEQDVSTCVPEVSEVPDFCESGLRAMITCEHKEELEFLPYPGKTVPSGGEEQEGAAEEESIKENETQKPRDIFFGGDSYVSGKPQSARRNLDIDFGGRKN
ncbi:MAG: 2-phosphosulfolactate phosphatase [Synergistaceae bacterium]|nr:2-phosphosulfolactate phosphatase [Synergistaceae bacterium]